MLLSHQVSLITFWLAFGAYISSFIFYAAKIKSPSRSYLKLATIFIISALILQTISLVLMVISVGGIQKITMFEIFTFASWFIVFQALIVELWSKVRILGLYVSPLAVIFMLAAWSQYKVPASIFANIKSTTTIFHVALIIIAYSAFFIAVGAAVFYIIQENQLKTKKTSSMFRFLPSLQVLDEVVYRSIISGFILFTIALAIGLASALKHWQAGWNISITIASAATWLTYFFYLYARFKMGWVGKKATYIAIAGIIPLIATSVITFLSRST